MRRPPALLIAVALTAALALGACGADDSPATTADSAIPATTNAVAGAEPVVKDVLAEMVDPPGGDGSTLTLIRYTIAPGARLDPHIHPGVQLASIESGTLTYTVETGTAVVHHADGTTEDVTGPVTTELGAGDAVQETLDMVHFGANETDEPVVILAALLTGDGEGLAVPVKTPAPTIP